MDFKGGVFSVLPLDQSRLLVVDERSSGGEIKYLDINDSTSSRKITGLPKTRDIFQVIKGLNFSDKYQELYVSALIQDPHQPRLGRLANDPTATKIAPSGLIVWRVVLNSGNTGFEDITELYREKPFLVSVGQFGGALLLSRDKNLFVTLGDNNQFEIYPQSKSFEVSKILRINLDGSPVDSNPFTQNGRRTKIFASGLRNPYGIIETKEGKLWAIDMGPLGGDELNLIQKGKNYGWPIVSSGVHYSGDYIPTTKGTSFVNPALTWIKAIAPSSLVEYHGTVYSEWRNDLLVSGLAGKSISRIHLFCGSDPKLVDTIDFGFRVRGIAELPDGNLLILEDGNPATLFLMTRK